MSIKEQLLTELISLLTKELTTHDSLIATAKQLNDAIKRSSVSEVQTLTQQYDLYISRIEELEEGRLALCDRYSKYNGSSSQHFTLSAIIALLDVSPQRDKLQQLRTDLKNRICELTRINTSNNVLLEASLSAVNKSFEIMVHSQEKFQGYGQGGILADNKTTRNFVNKIA